MPKDKPKKIPFVRHGWEHSTHNWRAKPEPGYLLVSRCQACGMIDFRHYRIDPDNSDLGSILWENPQAYERSCPARPPDTDRILRRLRSGSPPFQSGARQ